MNPPPRILCVGIAVLDLIMRVEAMPRRADKYRSRDADLVGGGCAANAAVAIARLGGSAHLAGCLGDDGIADMIESDLIAEGVDCTRLHRLEGRRSSFSSIYIDSSGERQIVNFRDICDEESASEAGRAMSMEGFDAILADTRWPAGADLAMRKARRLSIPGILDAEPPFDACPRALEDADHVFFSHRGLRAFSRLDDTERGLAFAAERIGGIVGVTEGADAVRWIDATGLHCQNSHPIDAVDTLGAGDAWHGALALALAQQACLRDAIVFANATAAIKCTRPGGRRGLPFRAEVERFMQAPATTAAPY
ncbi:PfkB family carbohydrate kinase [Thioalkalivibrio sp. HK1]|uniref:PfkB family carbohydrate kinase n=1 Tax=Thioalkalivibrio sp. HK1 TaxID=1469245 RepID=UPI000472E873|nr:PfkB family carbohydrate kinase [Thioalkalivibrio sp. HK1]